jgi:hypothetical protein
MKDNTVLLKIDDLAEIMTVVAGKQLGVSEKNITKWVFDNVAEMKGAAEQAAIAYGLSEPSQ